MYSLGKAPTQMAKAELRASLKSLMMLRVGVSSSGSWRHRWVLGINGTLCCALHYVPNRDFTGERQEVGGQSREVIHSPCSGPATPLVQTAGIPIIFAVSVIVQSVDCLLNQQVTMPTPDL